MTRTVPQLQCSTGLPAHVHADHSISAPDLRYWIARTWIIHRPSLEIPQHAIHRPTIAFVEYTMIVNEEHHPALLAPIQITLCRGRDQRLHEDLYNIQLAPLRPLRLILKFKSLPTPSISGNSANVKTNIEFFIALEFQALYSNSLVLGTVRISLT